MLGDHQQIAFASVRGLEKATSLDHTAFRGETIADVNKTIARISADDRVPDGIPVSLGNAISV